MIKFFLTFSAIFSFLVQASENHYQKNKTWQQDLQFMIKKQDNKIFQKFMTHYPRKPGPDLEEYRRTVFTLLKSHPEFFSSAVEKVYAGNHDCYLRWVALGDDKSDLTIRKAEKIKLMERLSGDAQVRFKAISKSNGAELKVKNCN